MHRESANGSSGRGVLFVCTADVVRSPLAAALLRSRLPAAASPPSSAGVRARPGDRFDPVAQEIALAAGLDLSEHRSRPVTPDLLASPLVLAMTENQRTHLVRTVPTVLPRTFTLLEFLRLVDSHASLPSSLPEIAQAAHLARPRVAPAAEPESVADPHGGSVEQYEATFGLLSRLTDALSQRIAHVTS
jgi:low molecular weight protein-tyrosine phosphatase